LIFPTVEFACFFLVAFTGCWMLAPHPRLWKPFVLVASYAFYGYADWRFCFLLAGVTLWNQAFARALGKRPSNVLLAIAIAGDLAALGWFKYYGFFAQSFDDALGRLGLGAPLPLLQIALPIGVSFFTFQAITYVVDVRRGVVEPASTLDAAVYLAFFPHLVAGPIVRASEFLPQLRQPRRAEDIPVAEAFGLIAGGLIKKVVLADVVASNLVDPVFGSPQAHSGGELLLATYAYALQVFCDFSAYTDIAIGVALLLGIRFPQNFDRPYTATSFSDFWRRWHMTLSRFLRDYLYVPLGGNRRGRRRTYVNLGLTMVLGGLWHGAAWTFVVWGALHGSFLALERLLANVVSWRPPAWLARVIVFHGVCLAWVFFRADSIGTAGEVLTRIATFASGTGGSLIGVAVVLALVAGALTQVSPPRVTGGIRVAWTRLPVVAQGVSLGLVLMAASTLGHEGVAPFIYFRF
jgi:alginate O-acetyltransferase complex protein AlgI